MPESFTTRLNDYLKAAYPILAIETHEEMRVIADIRQVVANRTWPKEEPPKKAGGKPTITIWGDGTPTRSFMYIDDCLIGTQAITKSDILEPINLGSAEMVSINQLVDLVEDIAGIKLKRSYKLDAPKGVRGRSSDNALIKEKLDWEPAITLRNGLEKTYAWIYDQLKSGASKDSVFNRF